MAGIFTGKSQEMYDLHEKSRIHRINLVDTHNQTNDWVDNSLRLQNDFRDNQSSQNDNLNGLADKKERNNRSRSDPRIEIKQEQSVELVA